METNEGLYAALRKINRAGAVLLQNVGVEEKAVLDLARRIGSISHDGSHAEFNVDSQVLQVGRTGERIGSLEVILVFGVKI